jgi:hypothetical protein
MTSTKSHAHDGLTAEGKWSLDAVSRRRAAVPTTRERLHRLADELDRLTNAQLVLVVDAVNRVEIWP